MSINLHIDKLVLDGLPVGSHESSVVQAAVEAELARLVWEGRFAEEFGADRSVPLVRPGTIAVPAGDPDRLGGQIGRTIFAGISR
jgi:hypothetical protein